MSLQRSFKDFKPTKWKSLPVFLHACPKCRGAIADDLNDLVCINCGFRISQRSEYYTMLTGERTVNAKDSTKS